MKREAIDPAAHATATSAEAELGRREDAHSVSSTRGASSGTRAPLALGRTDAEAHALRQGAAPTGTENALAVVPGSNLADELVGLS